MFAALLRARLPSSWGVECVSLNPGNIASDVTRTLPQPIQWIHKVRKHDTTLHSQPRHCTPQPALLM